MLGRQKPYLAGLRSWFQTAPQSGRWCTAPLRLLREKSPRAGGARRLGEEGERQGGKGGGRHALEEERGQLVRRGPGVSWQRAEDHTGVKGLENARECDGGIRRVDADAGRRGQALYRRGVRGQAATELRASSWQPVNKQRRDRQVRHAVHAGHRWRSGARGGGGEGSRRSINRRR